MTKSEQKQLEPALEAVIKLLSSVGPDGVTFRQVAKLARISQGSLSYAYKTKNDLFWASLDWLLMKFEKGLSELWDEAKTPRKKLESIYRWQEKLLVESPELITAWYAFVVLGRSDKWIAAKVQEYLVDRVELIRGIIKNNGTKTNKGAAFTPGRSASDITASIEGMGLLWLNHPNPAGIAAHRRRTVKRWIRLLDLSDSEI